MARIKVRRKGEAPDAARMIDILPSHSVLNRLLAAGEVIPHDCGGKAMCGTCRVRVGEGGRHLPAPGLVESERLRAVGAGPDERLACQIHAPRDLDIEIVGRKRPGTA
jgi:adenylate cyclase